MMTEENKNDYILEDQIGFLMRLINQRHANIFAAHINESLTPTQFSVLVKLKQLGACSQNLLGRKTAVDVATIKGVVERLNKRGYIRTFPDIKDKRRILIELTEQGLAVIEDAIELGRKITEETLKPLKKSEQKILLKYLKKIT